jgi:hypothetical protein
VPVSLDAGKRYELSVSSGNDIGASGSVPAGV